MKRRILLVLLLLTVAFGAVYTAEAELLSLPEDLKRIESKSFMGISADRVYFPAGIEYIADDAFSGVSFIGEGEPGTYAQEWCIAHGIEYQAVGGQTARPVLPDPNAFFSSLNYNELPHYNKSYNGYHFSFKSTALYVDALWEYLDCVVNSYPYVISHSYENTMLGGTYHNWERYLTYTGPETLNAVNQAPDNRYAGSQVIIVLQQDMKSNVALFSVIYSDGISFTDNGERCSRDNMPDIGRNAENGGTSGGNTGGGQGNTVCTECGGKGYRLCHTCGGDGTIDIYVSTPGYGGVGTGSNTVQHKPCSNIFCHGGRVECFFCHGTGKQ